VKGGGMKAHKYADIFPMLEGAEADALTESMRKSGYDVRHPIVTFEGAILDGRNRFLAAKRAGVKPSFVEFNGTDPLGYVVLANVARRHLDPSQTAMVGARIRAIYDEEAKARQVRKPNDSVVEKLPPQNAGAKSRDLAGAAVGVSGRSVDMATKVIAQGAPELARAVDAGKIAVSAAVKLVELPKAEQSKIVAKVERGEVKPAAVVAEVARVARVEKIAEIAKGNAPLPKGETAQRYPVIYSDPPWRYEHVKTESRAIENQYPTMALEEICALDVAKLTTDDAILFLWKTAPKLSEAMQVITAWGFTYRTGMIWDKQKIGMGYYARIQHEHLLIATKGNIPVPPPSVRPSSVVSIAREEHSAKPHEFAELIERMYPELPKLEMFCRSPRPGWSVWGNQSRVA